MRTQTVNNNKGICENAKTLKYIFLEALDGYAYSKEYESPDKYLINVENVELRLKLYEALKPIEFFVRGIASFDKEYRHDREKGIMCFGALVYSLQKAVSLIEEYE